MSSEPVNLTDLLALKARERERLEATPQEAPAPESTAAPEHRQPAPGRAAPREAPARQAPAPGSTAEGYTSIPNWIFDEFLPRLDQYEQAVMYRLYRLTIGFRGRETCLVSYARIAELARISENSVIRAVKRLVAAGHLETRAIISGKVTARGVEFRVTASALPPQAPVPEASAPRRPARQASARESVMTDMTTKGETAPDRFEIRARAAPILEAERDITHGELVTAVRRAYASEGVTVSEGVIAAALEGKGR